MKALGEYKDAIVLIGGWTPFFLLEGNPPTGEGRGGFGAGVFRHVGSIDIDLAIDPTKLTGEEYDTMVELLLGRGYVQDPKIRYRLNRSLRGLDTPIGVDFLTPKPAWQGRGRRHHKVQVDLQARATPHLEVAFEFSEPYMLEGELPEGGGRTRLEFKIASLPAMFTLKGMAMGDYGRYKEKDSYDVYALARYYGHDIDDVVAALKPHLGREALKIGLGHIRNQFESDKHAGPRQVARFIGVPPEEEERIVQDAFLSVDAVLRGCSL